MESVLNIHKPVGFTPLEAITAYRQLRPEYKNVPMTYAGRLDPMAEGVLLVLSGEEAKNREPYLSLDKTYEAEVLLGFSTDTGDVLGIASMGDPRIENKALSISHKDVAETLDTLKGTIVLPVPAYSSVPVKGKPLFEWARSGRLGEIEIPERKMEIFNVNILGTRTEDSQNVLNFIQHKIQKVQGDFRQQEIAEQWKKVLGDNSYNYDIASVSVHCSSGTYIRSLAEELGRRVGIPAVLYNLKRTKVGKFTLKDSINV